MAWHVAGSLEKLREQLNSLFPNRSKAADGGIGDAAHATRDSDHNPWYRNTVTARDFTHDPANGLDCQWLKERLVASRDPRIKYLIWDRRIISGAGGPDPWKSRTYRGSNPHTRHLHVSVVASPLCEDRAAWRLVPATTQNGFRTLKLTDPPMTGDDVRAVQRVLRAWYSLPTSFIDGVYGPQTATQVARAQNGVPPHPQLDDDGICGPLTYRKLGLA
jgi:hypothetical protein